MRSIRKYIMVAAWRHLLFALLVFPRGCRPILLLGLQVPPYVRLGDDVRLTCMYDLEYDGLYSLKWYKDDREFYSYVPRMNEGGAPRRFFPVPGLSVDEETADDRQVVVRNASLMTSGEFRCQVSGEGPLFATVTTSKMLRVAVVPELPPQVSRLPASFSPGDWLHLNCTSGRSNPGARLTWIVNGKEAGDEMLRKFPSVDHGGGFKTSILGLQFWLRRGHFAQDGKLRVKCRARIADVYFSESLLHVVGRVHGEQANSREEEDAYGREATGVDASDRVMHATASAQRHFTSLNILILSFVLLLLPKQSFPS